jgi:ElaB/YqjD/DUF883 family membrane-anchored ribosome-binding protein
MQTTTLDPTQTGLSDKAAAGIDRLSSGAHQTVDRVAQAATTAAEQIGQRGEQLRAKQEMWAESARECVRRHPMASVGIALGIGLLLSLFGRSSSMH